MSRRTRATWDLPGTLGRRYARVSGDWNPIHLSSLTARPFGYRRPIAHGMWTLGRAFAAMPLPESFTVDATFASSLTLPSAVESQPRTIGSAFDQPPIGTPAPTS